MTGSENAKGCHHQLMLMWFLKQHFELNMLAASNYRQLRNFEFSIFNKKPLNEVGAKHKIIKRL